MALFFDVSGTQDGLYTLGINSAEGTISRPVSLTTKTRQRMISFYQHRKYGTERFTRKTHLPCYNHITYSYSYNLVSIIRYIF